MVTEGREMCKGDMSIIQTQDVKNLAMSEDMMRKEHIWKTIQRLHSIGRNADAFGRSRHRILYFIKYASYTFS